jgi:hypothetical protein
MTREDEIIGTIEDVVGDTPLVDRGINVSTAMAGKPHG